jgi:hypothetical protein
MSVADIYRNRGVNPLAVPRWSRRLRDYPPLFNDANLVSYWALDGNSSDAKGVQNGVGTDIVYSLANGIAPTGIAPTIGAGFNGSTSYIALAHNTALHPSAFSIMAWAKTTMTADGDVYRYRLHGQVLEFERDGKIVFYVWDDAPTTNPAIRSSAAYNDGLWHLLVGTYGATTGILYIDGYAVANNAALDALYYDPTGYSAIGRAGDLAGAYFNGAICDVALFSRVLTPAEVLVYYGWSK